MDTAAATRILQGLPRSAFKVTSYPVLSWDFYTPSEGSLFRGYLYDAATRTYLTDQGVQIALLRAADEITDGIYGKALRIDPAVGTVLNHSKEIDAALGGKWSLTFVLIPRWDVQPGAASALYPFWHAGTNSPRFGYDEEAGEVVAQGWYGATTLGPVSLSFAAGWLPQQAIVATLVTDDEAETTQLWVNGILQDSLTESISANLAEVVKLRRTATAAETGASDLEAYFLHPVALEEAQIQALHTMFTTGYVNESRWVRHAMALAMVFGEIEYIGFNLYVNTQVNNAVGGALTRLAMDYKVPRRAGEDDDSLRVRVRNRLLEIFANGSVNQLIQIAAARTGLTEQDIVLRNRTDENGDFAPMEFTVQLPPGQDSQLPALLQAMQAAAMAGVLAHVGTSGSFAWDVAGAGWELGGWNFVR